MILYCTLVNYNCVYWTSSLCRKCGCVIYKTFLSSVINIRLWFKVLCFYFKCWFMIYLYSKFYVHIFLYIHKFFLNKKLFWYFIVIFLFIKPVDNDVSNIYLQYLYTRQIFAMCYFCPTKVPVILPGVIFALTGLCLKRYWANGPTIK